MIPTAVFFSETWHCGKAL